MIKEAIRWLIWPIAVLMGGEFYAEAGTLKCRFFNWLYGDDEDAVIPVSDGWVYPDKED